LLYRSYAGRAFFVVPAEAHRETLYERAVRLMRHRCWSQHYKLYGLEDPT